MALIDPVMLKTRLGALAGRFDVDALDECDSTNSELMRRAERGAPSGTVIVADRQSAGRGRRGRSWLSSPETSLTFSLFWRFPGNASRLSGLSLAVGVGLARALNGLGGAGIRLKWPNDVLLARPGEFAKLAGILIELSSDRRGTQAIVGIGLNLAAPAEDLPQPAAGLAEAGVVADRHQVLAAIRTDNIDAPVGNITIGQSDKSVRVDARFKEAQTSPQLADDLYKVGRKVAAVCANCHGEGGTSTKPSIPNLAGQNPAYLLEQMRQFADGRRRNEFMEGMIRAMNSDEKIGMVLFYAAQQVAHQTPANPMLAAKGQEYFEKTCFRCHGTGGRGNEQIARIAGQQPDYLRLTLQRYRAGTGVRANSIMTPNTKLMSDADIEAVVAYVSSMP